LYISEGCSSSPPADRWLSQLPPDSGVVPLAFHVDYWDKLAGTTPLLRPPSASVCARATARWAGCRHRSVMLDGKDFRSWHRGLTPQLKPALAQMGRRFNKSVDSQNGRLFLALVENRLNSKVEAGENAQRTLHHDHVVRQREGPRPLRAATVQAAIRLESG
jgi:hypothetical protein